MLYYFGTIHPNSGVHSSQLYVHFEDTTKSSDINILQCINVHPLRIMCNLEISFACSNSKRLFYNSKA